jgi:hypothetical protein
VGVNLRCGVWLGLNTLLRAILQIGGSHPRGRRRLQRQPSGSSWGENVECVLDKRRPFGQTDRGFHGRAVGAP